MNINANQAAQTAGYAGQAMNAFQAAVNIDNQQPKPEGTTFWFRWLIRIVAIVTGILAMICGVFGALSTSPSCIAAGAIMIFLGFAMIMFEVPICCQFVRFTQPVANFSENRPAWQKAFLYSIPPLLPLVLCQSISIVLGFICLLVNGAIQFMLVVGKKASREEMMQRAAGTDDGRGPRVPDGPSINAAGNKGFTFTQLPEKNVSVEFTLSSSPHSGSQPALNCSLTQCSSGSNNPIDCLQSSTPCFGYRNINNMSYCAPGILCSILESCNNINYSCISNTSACVVNSCCSPQAVCLPVSLVNLCKSGWINTGSMNNARYDHTASVLTNGKVLVAGGSYAGAPMNSTELYDPSTGVWAVTGSMNNALYSHTASLLISGKVLVVGGSYNNQVLNSAELYDPSAGVWTVTGIMNNTRFSHTASVLANGNVLVAGGEDYLGYIIENAEFYDPSTGFWTPTGSMNSARYLHTASVLTNGKVFVAGGHNGSFPLVSAELYDSSTGVWTLTGSMNNARFSHTASVLRDGKVLVAGGFNGSFLLESAELYDPSTGVWTVTGSMNNTRYDHTASVLTNGKVLVAGGIHDNQATDSAELYDPSTEIWALTNSMNNGRYLYTASLLTNGNVLVTGGLGFGINTLNSSELY
ncbi:unnamed protein product [Rotaria magnacalcarata]|uniref:Attractin/MKLN-like beta-propeller domain-containing protein n=1 Tax=Rotaria magnacalcarata TaxID=392030 RepID=A0A815R334_9BILA|nr:unnamed protein product [Rotaria magnacalcarata]CAF1486289.1 unnamed protein product [Rotaria magnacalcarata]